ncbi:damage-control phosphatase ARMT1 family protein [Streptacidiphilus melanogenes]|uniref:damage-control phosphatase ARMT1 family protein n=1 Tax=Streptacidiphilus melanogenes TaxID=411235 RepID=UPI0005AA1085|nr:damage-control phosphatase ARMT1 family protein [Streptacidiphilus melanogenes]
MTQQAPVIISSASPFAADVFRTRHPALIDRLIRAWPFAPAQLEALAELVKENLGGVIRPLPDHALGAHDWREWGSGFYGRPWAEVPFLWAESFFYRRLLEAVGYFEPSSPWRGVDLFAPFKQAELAGGTVAAEIAALDDIADAGEDERGQALLLSSLWGNRADLALQITAGAQIEASGLVADDSQHLWELLGSQPGGNVALVADNAGSEMVADLVLVDHLLARGLADQVVLHVKPAPYYVSDALLADVADCLRRLWSGEGAARAVAERLREAAAVGRLRMRTDAFWCAPFDFTAMPEALREDLAAAKVTILKGDLNYRRLVGDRWWDPTTSFSEVTRYFPGRVAALRTLKSDVIVGLEPRALDTLEASGRDWRTSGSRGLIQVR